MFHALAHRCRLAAVAGLVFALSSPALAAAPAAPAVPDKDATPAAKLKQQLDQTLTIDLAEQSLSAAVNQFHELTKINFVLDRLSIQQQGMDPEQLLVSVKLKEVKVRTALRAALGPYNLGYAVVGDTVLISTDDMAVYRQLHQRVNIDLEKVSLADALQKLSRDTAANVLLDPRVPAKGAKAEVNLQMEDVPLETAVRLIAEMAGLKPVRVGNVLFVTTKVHATEIRTDEQSQVPGQPQPGMVIDQGGLIPLQPPQPPPQAPPPPAPDKADPDKPVDKVEKPQEPIPPIEKKSDKTP